MSPFSRAFIPPPRAAETHEVDYDGNSNRYVCRLRIAVADTKRIANYVPGRTVTLNGSPYVITSTPLDRGRDSNQIGVSIIEFEAVSMAQLIAGMRDPDTPVGTTKSGQVVKPVVYRDAQFGPAKRKLLL